MDKIFNISPIDGRYEAKVKELKNYFSEAALINFRIKVESEYFIFLIDFLFKKHKISKTLSDSEKRFIRSIYEKIEENAYNVKKIETEGIDGKGPTNHDVKAVEYYLKKTFENKLSLNIEFIHFGLTSEDVNNIAYSLMIESFIKNEYISKIEKILEKLKDFALQYNDLIFPARTHGQIASPTTFGKEMRIFAERLERKIKRIKKHRLLVKLNGASGNYNAFYAAYPDIDWTEFTHQFINFINKNFSTSFIPNLHTTQIEPHDSWVELFMDIKHINNILIGLCQDIWRYISDDLIVLKKVEWEVGSSTMPHKVNPIDFENAEGNFQLANAILSFLSDKLPISRLQRDLTDSTVERNIGVGFAHTYLAFDSLLKGLSKIKPNEKKAYEIVNNSYEVYAEAIQTVLRKYSISNAYEILKDFSRGKKITKNDIKKFIDNLKISKKIKKEINNIISKPYTGLASQLAVINLLKRRGNG